MNKISYLTDNIEEYIPNEQVCLNLANFFSTFCDSTRLKIIVSLLYKEMCVNDLSNILNINQTTISHQLKVLKNSGAVTSTRQNKYIIYRVSNKFVSSIMLNGIDHYLDKKTAG